jgi:predicted anti-sigma-YlaC factor YlaD
MQLRTVGRVEPIAEVAVKARVGGELTRVGSRRGARMEEHIERCGRCRGACDSLKRTLALCRAAEAPQVPEDVKEAVRLGVRRFLDQAS